MCGRKRFTEPIAVRLHQAGHHLSESRKQLDRDAGPIALWHIMQALLNLERVKRKLDVNPD